MAKPPQKKSSTQRNKSGSSSTVVNVSTNVNVSQTSEMPEARALGVDVSQFQGTVNWDRVRAAGYSFSFIKSTQAVNHVDEMFRPNWVGAKQAGILRGAFHVFDTENDPLDQANYFLKTLAEDPGELPPVLDIEPFLIKELGGIAEGVKIWLEAVEAGLKRKPIIYSNSQLLQSIFFPAAGSKSEWVKGYPLWIASYPSASYRPNSVPPQLGGWDTWAFWQYTDRGSVDGVNSNVDLNVFNGTEEELRRFAANPAAVLSKLRLNFALNDRPQGPDRLDYEKYADAFAQVLSGQYTQTPLTVGVYASWGMGKSFLLGKIREKLDAIDKANNQMDFAFIDFNAWVYSGSENLWAGLITKLYDGIEKHYQIRDDRFLRKYRREESLKKWADLRKTLMLVLTFGIPAAIISILLDYQTIQSNWKTVADIFLLILGGAPLLSKLPDLLKGIQALIDSIVLLRSQELQKLSSRKDFRDRVGFMADIQSELRDISKLIQGLDKMRKQKTRFVIFVDDLDRCPPAKAVEVLEAIMLLLSDRDGDPFIVFLAMDARVLVKAVEMRYGEVLKDSGISGYEFLDKIVQIPFRIPPSPDAALKKYVQSLLYQSPEAQTKAEQPPEDKKEAGSVEPIVNKPPKTDVVSEPSQPKTDTPTEITPKIVSAPPEEEPFSMGEKEAFETYAKFISRNPRRVKRIVNIYRMARILISSDVAEAVAVKWTILTEQWPFRIAWVMQVIEDDLQLGHEISLDWTLAEMYEKVEAYVNDPRSHHLALLDEDAENFQAFVNTAPFITVGDIHKLWSVTFNVNPAMQNEVLKSALQVNGEERVKAA